ncbi:MAG: NUDIX hydrolase [Planctomycetota bacterium]
MKERWKPLASEVLHDAGIFQLRKDEYEHGGRPTHSYYVLETRPWINVVPITTDGQLILVRQFRHGIREVTLEVPGGVMDDTDGTPAEAAARELLEETGYRGDPPELLGAVSSNPAILTNRTYCFVARNLERVAELDLDPHEDIVVETRPVAEIPELIRSGAIHHSLSVAALSLYLLRGSDGHT